MVAKIVKENSLNIPIGTLLHLSVFLEGSKISEYNPPTEVWINNYIVNYKLPDESLHVLSYNDFQTHLEGCYLNCVRLYDKRKYITQGSEYWKVIYNEKNLKFHKLEFKDGKHYPAELFKPYRDIVHDNTNTYPNDYYCFETKKDAEIFCEKMKKHFANK